MKIIKQSLICAALIALFIPSFVMAETCNTDSVKPLSIEYTAKSDGAEELADASIEDGKVKTNVKLLEVGDYVKYKIILENSSEEEFGLEGLSFDDDSAVLYTIELADGAKTIGAGETRDAYLTIEYKNKLTEADFEDSTFTDSGSVSLVFSRGGIVPNPNTASDFPVISVVVIAATALVLFAVSLKNGKRRFMAIILMFAIFLIPTDVFAVCKCVIEIESKVTIPQYQGREINNVVMDKPIIDDEHSDFMEPVTGVNFLEPSSDVNGKGIYIFAPTKNDDVPIYYYRGAVDNNNLIFVNFCWKIFRTTETEGLKIIYNGVPTNGQCVAEGADTMIATGVKYNASLNNLSYFGYSYASNGHTFSYMSNSKITNGMIFANDVTYEDGHYKLSGDQYEKDDDFANKRDEILKTHHYTCFKNAADECETVRYVYMTRSVNMFYVTLKNGEKIEDVVDHEVVNEVNENKSIVRTTVDDWYEQNMTAYTKDLEDVVWCNDRSLYDVGGWNKDKDVLEITNEQDGKMTFNANYRVFTTGKPDINCANKNDAFTVSTENGNGDLDYPVGLMTLDEAVMAGFNWYRYNNSSDNYLNNGMGWWLMSPSLVSANNIYVGVAYSRVDHVTPTYTTNGLGGVRPMVSLKKGFKITSGNGTSSNPFTLGN